MLKGLFINNKRARDSIFESGNMVYECLRFSQHVQFDYVEIDASDRTIPLGYDFYFFNYHPVTMGWLDTSQLKTLLGNVGTIVLEVYPGDPFVLCPEKDFGFYVVLDPSYQSKRKNVFSFPRPLDKIVPKVSMAKTDVPVIGTFGFATKGKGFQHVVEAVNKEFEKAIVRINIPYGDFIPDSEAYAKYLASICIQKAKRGIEVVVTHDFMTKQELVDWCASNTLNCFLYDRDMPGLAATTDQAILSKRPLSISNNDTFRHIKQYLKPYPKFSLMDSIEKSEPIVAKILEDWQPHNFQRRFEEMLLELQLASVGQVVQTKIELPVTGKIEVSLFSKYKRAYRRINNRIKNGYYLRRLKHHELI
jgi:hypothetical protein